MINTIIIRGALHMFNLLNVTMSRCHNVTMCIREKLHRADACHGLKECLPRVMEGISL